MSEEEIGDKPVADFSLEKEDLPKPEDVIVTDRGVMGGTRQELEARQPPKADIVIDEGDMAPEISVEEDDLAPPTPEITVKSKDLLTPDEKKRTEKFLKEPGPSIDEVNRQIDRAKKPNIFEKIIRRARGK